MTIRAILFDLDNTLYPASSGLMEHLDRRITEYVRQRLNLSEVEVQEIRRSYYTTYGTTLRGLLQNYHNVDSDDYLQFVHDIAIEEFLAINAELDTALTRLDVRKIIFTNSPREHAERVLQALGIAQHFERVFDLRYFNFIAKPDPHCYQHLLDELGVAGSEAVFIEDTPQNLDPAKALGLTTVLISDTLQPYPAADYVVPDLRTALETCAPLIAQRVSVLPTANAGKRKQPVRVRRSA